jgi:hypothetical protein
VLAVPPTDDRYLAGGAAMHFSPNSTRYSDDLDFFHDSEARVASAFAADRERLQRAGYALEIELSLPGFVRAVVRLGGHATRRFLMIREHSGDQGGAVVYVENWLAELKARVKQH